MSNLGYLFRQRWNEYINFRKIAKMGVVEADEEFFADFFYLSKTQIKE